MSSDGMSSGMPETMIVFVHSVDCGWIERRRLKVFWSAGDSTSSMYDVESVTEVAGEDVVMPEVAGVLDFL